MANFKLLLVLLVAVTVSLVTSKSVRKLRSAALFTQVDTDGDGFVTGEELKEYLVNRSIPDKGVDMLFMANHYLAGVDAGERDGKLDENEFNQLAIVHMTES